MNRLHALLELFLPAREADTTIRNAAPAAWLATYQPHQPHEIEGVVALTHYKEPLIQAAITEQKFNANKRASNALGSLLSHWVEDHPHSYRFFIPIPLSRTRLRQRGHNQIETLLRTTVPRERIATKILTRSIDTPPQTSLPRAKRLANMENAFTVDLTALHKLPIDAEIVLIDDVVTTGATILAARTALEPHLKPEQTLRCLAIAH